MEPGVTLIHPTLSAGSHVGCDTVLPVYTLSLPAGTWVWCEMSDHFTLFFTKTAVQCVC